MGSVLAVYAALLILLSVPFVVCNWPPGAHLAGSRIGWPAYPYNTLSMNWVSDP